mmetsp:Transcript_5578/g.9813  ORF Transcript_5578/g.9813 Transcript_5578/m.9813 type:complete len:267 (+) Transcript_5578:2686-3486(+)
MKNTLRVITPARLVPLPRNSRAPQSTCFALEATPMFDQTLLLLTTTARHLLPMHHLTQHNLLLSWPIPSSTIPPWYSTQQYSFRSLIPTQRATFPQFSTHTPTDESVLCIRYLLDHLSAVDSVVLSQSASFPRSFHSTFYVILTTAFPSFSQVHRAPLPMQTALDSPHFSSRYLGPLSLFAIHHWSSPIFLRILALSPSIHHAASQQFQPFPKRIHTEIHSHSTPIPALPRVSSPRFHSPHSLVSFPWNQSLPQQLHCVVVAVFHR